MVHLLPVLTPHHYQRPGLEMFLVLGATGHDEKMNQIRMIMSSVLLRIASWRKVSPGKRHARLLPRSWMSHGTRRGSGRNKLVAKGRFLERIPEDLEAENARVRPENQELRDTNESLKAVSAFFASKLGPKRWK